MLKQTVIRLPADLHRRARIAALDRDTTLQALIAKALEAYLRKGEGR